MKKILNPVLLVFFLTLLSCSSPRPDDGEYTIYIYATNDLHGRFFNDHYVGEGTHPFSLASVSSYLKDVRELHGEDSVILIDAGDNLQGDNSVFYYNYIDTISEHIFSRIANYLSYDAIVVGNHDIEAGHSVYDKITKELNAPYLAANAINIKSNKPYFTPYTIIDRGGVRVAIIGMTNPNIPKWLSPKLWEGIRFDEIPLSLEKWVKYVNKKEKPHITVVVLHAGLGEYNDYSVENPARYIASNISGIDVVFASHDHKRVAEVVYNNNHPVWILAGGSRASDLSAARVAITISDGRVFAKDIYGWNESMSGINADSSFLKYFANDYNIVKEFTNLEVGYLNTPITTRDAYFGPSAFIDMIHSLQLSVSGADVSFAAPLSFDISIDKGVLNYQDLMDVYPYENQLYVIEMSGKEIRDYLEYSYSKWINNISNGQTMLKLRKEDNQTDERMRFENIFFNFDSAAGVLYEVDITKGDNERVNIISMSNGSEFGYDKNYKVALTSYRANGGGDLLEKGAGIDKDLLEARVVERHPDIREIMFNYLRVNKSVSPSRLNHWKFVPEELAAEYIEREYILLFGRR